MITIQSLLHKLEVGEGRVLMRIIPLLVTLVLITALYDFSAYRGLNDPQSMDNAQLARQLATGAGYTTKFIRPRAVQQLTDWRAKQPDGPSLFPPELYPSGAPRILPDTYNAPGYPVLLAAWFQVIHPDFNQTIGGMAEHHVYSGERFIPELNQLFLLATGLLVFVLGRRLFDARVAWVGMLAFFSSDLVWRFSLSALSTSFLMFVVTGLFFAAVEIYRVGEACFQSEESDFRPAWIWALILALLLGVACLTRLHFLVLLLPLLPFVLLMPNSNFWLYPVIGIIVVLLVAPWLWHVDAVSGSPLGSNLPLLLYGQDQYEGNQVWCGMTLPGYEKVFKDTLVKEYVGFRWHLEHGWNLLGASPMLLFFGASLLHRFRQMRAVMLQWMLLACAVVLIAVNSLGADQPDALDAWNIVIILLPCVLVVGSAFFFLLLDRLDIAMPLVNNTIVVAVLLLGAAPLALTLGTAKSLFYNYPPYFPPYLAGVSRFAHTDEWVTTDMPWATAWYGNRASLWLPDSLADFERLHDTVCSTGLLLLSPVTLEKPVSNLLTGEEKEWLPFIGGSNLPPNFPLSNRAALPKGAPDYIIWSDVPRWK